MNDFLRSTLTAANEVARTAFRAGHEAGYREGFKAGIEEAKKIVNETFAANSSSQEPKV